MHKKLLKEIQYNKKRKFAKSDIITKEKPSKNHQNDVYVLQVVIILLCSIHISF